MNQPMGGQPGAGQAPGGQPQQPGGKPAGDLASAPSQEVISAFRTIAIFVASKMERGDPNASQMQQALGQLAASMQGGAGAKPPQAPGAMPPPAAAPAPAAGGAPAPTAPPGGAGPAPMGGRQIPARGQIPVM